MDPNRASLIEAIQNECHEDVLFYANQLISSGTVDLPVLQSRIVAALHVGDFNLAVSTIVDNSKVVQGKLDYLHAYALYRLGEYTKSLEISNGVLERTKKSFNTERYDEKAYIAMIHLRAQTFYKMGRYSEAANLYEGTLISGKNQYITTQEEHAENEEYLTNILATYSNAGLFQNLEEFMRSSPLSRMLTSGSSEVSYEVLFNYGCALVSGGAYTEGLAYVEKALHLISDAVDSEDASINELYIAKLQKAFIHHKLGETDVALDEYTMLLDSMDKTTTDPIYIVGLMNKTIASTTLSQDTLGSFTNVFKVIENNINDRMTMHQKTCILVNQVILRAWAKQGDEARELLKKLEKSSDLNLIQIAYLKAFSYLREKQYAKANECLVSIDSSKLSGDEQIILELSKIQILFSQNQYEECLRAFDALCAPNTGLLAKKYDSKTSTIRTAYPAVSSFYLYLYEKLNKTTQTSSYLNELIAYWKQYTENYKDKQSAEYAYYSQVLSHYLIESVKIYTTQGDYQKSLVVLKDLYEEAKKENNESSATVYSDQIFQIVSKHCPNEIGKYTDFFPNINTDDVNIEELETQGIQAITVSRAMGVTDDAQYLANGKRLYTPEKLEAVRQKKKALKKRRLPKHLTEEQADLNIKNGFTPDPHRWKPKWQRPQPEKKGKDKLGKIHKGPQGSGVSESKVETNVIPTNASKLKGGRRRR